MRVALVHDDLVQWGGAERVLAALTELFPEAPIYTSVYDEQNSLIKENFAGKKIITSFLQKLPGWKLLYKTLLPLYPIAFEQFDFSGFDLVISQTTRFAKAIITKPDTYHLCYCHTPPRFLWHYSGELHAKFAECFFSILRIFDQVSARRVDSWLAGSLNCRQRIKNTYKAEASVIYPFVDTDSFEGIDAFDGGYLLVIARLNSYKRVDIAISAASELRMPLKIIGSGPALPQLQQQAGPYVQFLGVVNEKLLRRVIAGCRALIVTAEDDFGLTPLEAGALGKPVIAFQKGGALETIIEGETGYFYNEQTAASLISSLKKLAENGYNKETCLKQAQKFSKKVFVTQFQQLVSTLPITCSGKG